MDGGLQAVTEPPRLLHARSQFGYTAHLAEALASEPEAVPAATQRALTSQATRRAEDRRRAVWQGSRARFWAELDYVSRTFGREAREELRALRRDLERLDRKLASL